MHRHSKRPRHDLQVYGSPVRVPPMRSDDCIVLTQWKPIFLFSSKAASFALVHRKPINIVAQSKQKLNLIDDVLFFPVKNREVAASLVTIIRTNFIFNVILRVPAVIVIAYYFVPNCHVFNCNEQEKWDGFQSLKLCCVLSNE